MADIKAGDIGTLNGEYFDTELPALCKIVRLKADHYSLIIEIPLVGNKKIMETGPDDGLVTLHFANDRDLKDETDKNIHTQAPTDVFFSLKKDKVFLNLQIPTSATKQTTGKLFGKKAKY